MNQRFNEHDSPLLRGGAFAPAARRDSFPPAKTLKCPSVTIQINHLNGGDPCGNRTHVCGVRGRRLNRLTNGPRRCKLNITRFRAGAKARSIRCISSPNETRFAGLPFGVTGNGETRLQSVRRGIHFPAGHIYPQTRVCGRLCRTKARGYPMLCIGIQGGPVPLGRFSRTFKTEQRRIITSKACLHILVG